MDPWAHICLARVRDNGDTSPRRGSGSDTPSPFWREGVFGAGGRGFGGQNGPKRPKTAFSRPPRADFGQFIPLRSQGFLKQAVVRGVSGECSFYVPVFSAFHADFGLKNRGL